MKQGLLLLCSLILFSCCDELNQNSQDKESMEVSTEGTSLLIANAFLNSVKEGSLTRSLNSPVYPDYYGGCYMSNEGKTVFKVVSGCSERARKDIGMRTRSANFEIEECKYSYNAMQSVLQKLDEKFLSPDFNEKRMELGWLGYGINNKDNVIEIDLKECIDGNIARFKAEIMDSPMFRFREGREFFSDVNKYDEQSEVESKSTKAASLLMGGKIWGINAWASIGYRAKDSSNDIGFVTAGHFGIPNTVISLTQNGEGMGYCSESTYGGIDAAFILFYDGYEITSTLTAYGMNSIVTTMPIVLIENNAVGKEGASTFYSKGKVLKTGRRVTSDGIAITNVTVTDYDSANGDSGGVVFDTVFNRLAGIHQGASKDHTEHYYVIEDDIRNAMKVTPY